MKRSFFFTAIIGCIYLGFGVFASSCTKTNTVRDSVFIKDSTIRIIRDTTHSYDTIYAVQPKNPITGHWVGSYFINGDAVDSLEYIFDIRPDGTVYAIGNGTNGTAGHASGPWTLNGVNFSATLTTMAVSNPENVQAVTAKYDSVSGRLTNGTWHFTTGGGGASGTFSLMRIP
jgi:hypothetical protein